MEHQKLYIHFGRIKHEALAAMLAVRANTARVAAQEAWRRAEEAAA
jgi:hypothetical protein